MSHLVGNPEDRFSHDAAHIFLNKMALHSRIFPHNLNFHNDFYDIKKIKDYILRIVYLVYKYLYVNMSLYHLVNFPCL